MPPGDMIYLILCSGLDPSQTYHYRVKMTNGGNTIYYPGAAVTVSVITATSGTPANNPDIAYQAEDGISHTTQPYFLYLSWVTGPQTSHPQASLDHTGAGIVANGNLYTGSNNAAGEIGYLLIDTKYTPTNSKGYGCFEKRIDKFHLHRS